MSSVDVAHSFFFRLAYANILLRVVSESNCIEKKIADSVYQIWRKSGQRNSVPDIVAEFINRGHDFKTPLMAGF